MRTFRSAGFRVALAATLLVIAVVLLSSLLARQAADPAGQYAFDFGTYHAAAGDVAAGRSPYAPQMLTAPVPAQGPGATLYKYPPVLAQVLVPLSGASLPTAAAVWLALQTAGIVLGVWIATFAGGAPRTGETMLWGAVAAALFLPNFDTVWKGNVSGIQALFVALALTGGVVAGGFVSAGAFLKTTPGVVALPALFAGRRLAGGMLLAGFGVLAVSAALSPQAWLDFVRVIPNLIAGTALYPTNLAPDSVVALALPGVPLAALLVRSAVIVVGLLALVVAVVVARRPGGWPAALVLAVAAALILPSSIWYHYLAVLLPIAAFAWCQGSSGERAALVLGGLLVTLSVLWLPLAILGATIVVVAALTVLWPARRPATEATSHG